VPEEPFVFKNVRLGKPILPSEVPKCPPSVLKVLLTKLREENVGAAGVDLAVEVVYICLRRLDSSISLQAMADDEDLDLVMRAFRFIQKENPSIFPPAAEKSATSTPVDVSPKGERPT
jgi:hypothetical protein